MEQQCPLLHRDDRAVASPSQPLGVYHYFPHSCTCTFLSSVLYSSERACVRACVCVVCCVCGYTYVGVYCVCARACIVCLCMRGCCDLLLSIAGPLWRPCIWQAFADNAKVMDRINQYLQSIRNYCFTSHMHHVLGMIRLLGREFIISGIYYFRKVASRFPSHIRSSRPLSPPSWWVVVDRS